MPITTPSIGQDPWGGTLNTALNSLQDQTIRKPNPPAYTLAAWTVDPATVNASQTTTNGLVTLSRLEIPESTTLTRFMWGIGSGGITPTAGANFVGLYNSAGTRLTTVGVDARITSTGLFTETISVAVTPGFYWAAFTFTAATPPQVYRGASLNATLLNAGVQTSAASLRFCSNGSSTTLPASITPASNSATQTAFFFAVG